MPVSYDFAIGNPRDIGPVESSVTSKYDLRPPCALKWRVPLEDIAATAGSLRKSGTMTVKEPSDCTLAVATDVLLEGKLPPEFPMPRMKYPRASMLASYSTSSVN